MATYKVIQDIEAEDRLVGFLTLKGFVYAAIAATLAFINVRLLLSGSIGMFKWVFILLFLPPMALFAVLALPLGKEQPTESWLLSHIRFYLKSRKRIWDQRGSRVSVTVTAPKKIEQQLTKGLSESEVSSRLKALSLTLDTRGWAVKNVNVNMNRPDDYAQDVPSSSDRLVDVSSVQPDHEDDSDVKASDDILDPHSNPVAKHFETLVKKADAKRKEGLRQIFNTEDKHADTEPDFQFMTESKPEPKSAHETHVVNPLPKAERTKLEDSPHFKQRLKKAEAAFLAKRVPEIPKTEAAKIVKKSPEPAHQVPATTPAVRPQPTPAQKSTDPYRAGKLELAQSGNDLSVASIAHLANRGIQTKQIGPNEVEISLH